MSYKDIFNYHGWREQNKHLVSETHELTEAIHDHEIEGDLKTLNHITEEVADVLFMINEIIEVYGIDVDKIDDWLDFKGNRESKRIREGYYEK